MNQNKMDQKIKEFINIYGDIEVWQTHKLKVNW
jgi:hypothetical protein